YYTVAPESKAKCTCCNVRYADYNVRVNGSDTFTEQYCNECKANHVKSLKFPGKDLIYSAIRGSHPVNPQPPKSAPSKKCSCCRWRDPDYNAYNEGSSHITASYCKQCKELHKTSATYAGRSLKYKKYNSPKTSSETSLFETSSSETPSESDEEPELQNCFCCEDDYEVSAVITMQYLCKDKDHHINVCYNCAKQHRTCPYDCANMTLDSMKDFVDMLRDKNIDKKPYKK
uniref:Uncharacterized protein n=1 Tax=Amphimedon queenslandica TaxID=400682 RepID=A0A1X7V4G7_AMPQE